MAITICLAQSKGGTGKTTSTLNVGAALMQQGYRVLVVDIDQQSNLTTSLGVDPIELPKTMKALLTENSTSVEDVLVRTEDGLDLIPANFDLNYAEAGMPGIAKEKTLARKLNSVKDQYDFILIDTPPYFGTMVINAMTASDYILVPVQPERACIEGLSLLVENLSTIRDNLHPNLSLLGLFVTLYNRSRAAHVQITEHLQEQWGEDMFKTILRASNKNDKASFESRPIVLSQPNSELAQGYKELTQEILKRVKK